MTKAEAASSQTNKITENYADYVNINTAVKITCVHTQAFIIFSVAYNSITAAQNANHITRNREASNSYTTLPSQTDPLLLPAYWGGGFHWIHRREEDEASIHSWRCLSLCFLACNVPGASRVSSKYNKVGHCLIVGSDRVNSTMCVCVNTWQCTWTRISNEPPSHTAYIILV